MTIKHQSGAKHLAVGLQYDGVQTPSISVVAREKLARQVTDIARRYGVPLQYDDALAEKLAELEIEEEIPEEMYEEVATLLIALERDNKRANKS